MRPYYADEWVTIYHADYRDVTVANPGLVLADPPYGIGHPTDYASRGRVRLAGTNDFERVEGDSEPYDPRPILALGAPTVLWGANYYANRLPSSSGWLVWDKRVQEGKGVNDQADGELAWTNCVKGVRIFRHMWNGFWRDSERGESYHPMQKPAALMSWALWKVGKIEGVVFDPYMGGGPVPVACKNRGLRCIAVEKVERYCEIAAERLSQGILALDNPPTTDDSGEAA